ncbi:MAG: ABC transporter permease subunit [Termitinemataceae bacterium]|nr:MAG: ABC transporter permease subunit [Termitinemataceae bacterium]
MQEIMFGKKILPVVASILSIFLLWEIVCLLVGNAIILPSPIMVLKTMLGLLGTAAFLAALGATSLRLLIGLLISAPLGIVVGLVCGVNKTVRWFFKPIFTIIAATPVMSVILIAYLAFGSEKTPIFTAFLMVFPVMAANTIAGITAIDTKYIELCNIYNLSRSQRIKYMYLPFIMPFLAGGFRSAMSLAWKVVVAAEVLVQPLAALGSGMQLAKANLETSELFAWTACTVIAAALSELLFSNAVRLRDFVRLIFSSLTRTEK